MTTFRSIAGPPRFYTPHEREALAGNLQRYLRQVEIERARMRPLKTRTLRCLGWALGHPADIMHASALHEVVTPERVATLRGQDLMREENFGRVSLADVRSWLAQYSLKLADE